MAPRESPIGYRAILPPQRAGLDSGAGGAKDTIYRVKQVHPRGYGAGRKDRRRGNLPFRGSLSVRPRWYNPCLSVFIMRESRRSFLRRAGAIAVPLLLGRGFEAEASAFFDVRERGAKGDGRAKDTRAIQAAIDAAARAGGTVRFPAGDYVSGTLRLRSHVTLRLEGEATLLASPDKDDFDPPEEPGYETFSDRETSDFSFALLQGRRV